MAKPTKFVLGKFYWNHIDQYEAKLIAFIDDRTFAFQKPDGRTIVRTVADAKQEFRLGRNK